MATEDIDYYGVLDVSPTATLPEINTAFRKRSLKVHPDRNPDNPQAAALFHELRKAADILLDPIQRASFDALLHARNARKLRFSGLDNKRKAMAEDLARREEEFKRSKGFEDAKGREERGALDRLKEEGKRMREEREKKDAGVVEREEEAEKVRAKERRAKERREGNDGAIELGPLDMTLKVKWLRTSRPHLVDAGLVKVWLSTLTAPQPCGIDSIAISPKFLRDTGKGKWGSAAIAFVSLKAAVRLMELCEAGKGTKEWEGVEVGWAAGECPAVLRKEEEVPVRASFPASMVVDSDEDRILSLLRAKERARLIAEMEAEDAAS